MWVLCFLGDFGFFWYRDCNFNVWGLCKICGNFGYYFVYYGVWDWIDSRFVYFDW